MCESLDEVTISTFRETSCDEEKLSSLEIEDTKPVAINENLFDE